MNTKQQKEYNKLINELRQIMQNKNILAYTFVYGWDILHFAEEIKQIARNIWVYTTEEGEIFYEAGKNEGIQALQRIRNVYTQAIQTGNIQAIWNSIANEIQHLQQSKYTNTYTYFFVEKNCIYIVWNGEKYKFAEIKNWYMTIYTQKQRPDIQKGIWNIIRGMIQKYGKQRVSITYSTQGIDLRNYKLLPRESRISYIDRRKIWEKGNWRFKIYKLDIKIMLQKIQKIIIKKFKN